MINKNEYYQLPIIEGNWCDIVNQDAKVYFVVRTSGTWTKTEYVEEKEDIWGDIFEDWGLDEEDIVVDEPTVSCDDDIELCCSTEFVPIENLVYDYTKQKIYLRYAEYDYIVPCTLKEKKMMLKLLASSGFFGVRYNQRQAVKVIGNEPIECFVIGNNTIKRYNIISFDGLVPKDYTLEEVIDSYIRCSKCTLTDFIDNTSNHIYFPTWKGVRGKQRHLINMAKVRWEDKLCSDFHSYKNNFVRFLDYTELYELLKSGKYNSHCMKQVDVDNISNDVAYKLRYIEQALNLTGVSRAKRLADFKCKMYGYISATTSEHREYFKQNPKHWYRKIKYNGVSILVYKAWFEGNKNGQNLV